MRVKSTVPEWTVGLAPCAVRNRPYTSQGWRPSSAVIQPTVFAMYGRGNASMRIHSMGRARSSRPAHQRSTAASAIAVRMVPSPAMM